MYGMFVGKDQEWRPESGAVLQCRYFTIKNPHFKSTMKSHFLASPSSDASPKTITVLPHDPFKSTAPPSSFVRNPRLSQAHTF